MAQSPWPAVVFLLTRGPRTRQQLMELTGCSRMDSIPGILKRLMDEGLVIRTREPQGLGRGKGKQPFVYHWAVNVNTDKEQA